MNNMTKTDSIHDPEGYETEGGLCVFTIVPTFDFFNAAKVIILVGGIYVFTIVPTTALIVFTGPKIYHDSHGYSKGFVTLGQSLIWVGFAAASVIIMPISDRIGRKKVIYMLLCGAFLAVVVSCITRAAGVYAVSVFMIGFTCPPAGILAYLLTSESVPRKWLPNVTAFLNMASALLVIPMALICKATRGMDWRVQTMMWYIPAFALMLIGPWFVNESPAFQALQTKGCPHETFTAVSSSLEQKLATDNLFAPPLRRLLFATVLCWTTCSFSLYGTAYLARNLSPDVYLNMVLTSIVGALGSAAAAPLMRLFNPIRTQLYAFSLAALVLTACAFFTPRSTALMMTALVSRFAINVSYTTIYVLIVDHFPDCCRSTAMGMANAVARITSALCPSMFLIPTSVACPVIGALNLAAAYATYKMLKWFPTGGEKRKDEAKIDNCEAKVDNCESQLQLHSQHMKC